MGSLTTGWIQLYSESAQEAYDNLIQAVRIAEHPDVLLPVMVCQDGFITSHGIENLNLLPDEVVKEFVGEYKPEHYLLNLENPITVGPLALQDSYTEVKYQQAKAMENAKQVILDIAAEYEKISGRKYGLFEAYKMEDAERAIVVLSSTAGTAKAVVDNLRAKGEKVGLLKPRVLRPFPKRNWWTLCPQCRQWQFMDRAETFSTAGGQLFVELRSAFYESEKRPLMKNYILGLGGRDTTTREITKVYSDLAAALEKGRVEELITHLDVRE